MALFLRLALALTLPSCSLAAPPRVLDVDTFDLENYDLNGETDWENIDLNNYGDAYDYDDLEQPVSGTHGDCNGAGGWYLEN